MTIILFGRHDGRILVVVVDELSMAIPIRPPLSLSVQIPVVIEQWCLLLLPPLVTSSLHRHCGKERVVEVDEGKVV